MAQHDGFLRALIQNPDDDTVRLVYSDWLDENGNSDRADFIRTQIRLAQMKQWDDDYLELDIRCRELLRQHGEWLEWLRPFIQEHPARFGLEPFVFDRGFPARVALKTDDLVRDHKRLFGIGPIRRITLSLANWTGNNSWEALPQSSCDKLPEMDRLSELAFTLFQADSAAADVIGCLRRAKALAHVGLLGCRFRESDIREVLAAPSVLQARSLHIGGTPLSDAAEERLRHCIFPNLHRLIRHGVSDLAWLKAKWALQLNELWITDSNENVTAEHAQLLATMVPEMQLTALQLGDLGRWPLDQSGAAALGASVHRASLRFLGLQLPYQSSPAIFRSLVDPAGPTALRILFVQGASINEESIGLLMDGSLGAALGMCSLSNLSIEAVLRIAKGRGLPELRALGIGAVWDRPDAPLAEAVRSVLDAHTLPKLIRLSIGDCRSYHPTPSGYAPLGGGPLVDPVAKAIASSFGASRLQELILGGLGAVSRSGATALAESRNLDQLRLLDVALAHDDKDTGAILSDRFGGRVNFGGGLYEPY